MQEQKKQLTPERWKDVERIFIKALDLPTEARTDYLEKACAGSETLRVEIDSLLVAHIETVGVLDVFDAERAAGLLRTELPLESFQFGPYKVAREVGRGGMGTVYEAFRADGQFEQKVALKVIKKGLDSEALVQRFLTERQILARLHHPQIARLLDGGMSDDGRPFIAMEYINGKSITAFCDAQKLSLNHRLDLFLKVCDAVQYAHRNLVVHRDLKPGNILVTQAGEVKLLDFGIAKVLEEAAGENTNLHTDTGLKAMTPEYASPEQVKGEAITTSTDVYALGVVLYEMLVGCRPYYFDRKSMSAVVKAICETDPARPIANLNEETISKVASDRSISVSRLRRLLTGDLEAILMKVLAKDHEDRYVSVEAIQEDVKRYRAGLPVLSRAGKVTYVVKKFVARHRFAVAALATFIVLLSGFSVVLSLQANRLATERNKSANEAEKAIAVAGFLEDIFEASDPGVARNDTITAKDLLTRGMARIDNELASQPEIQAHMMQVLGRVHYKMFFFDQSEILLRQAIERLKIVEGESGLRTASGMYDLARTLINQEKVGWEVESEALLREAFAIQQQAGGAKKEMAYTLFMLGHLLHKKSDHSGAKEVARQAIGFFEEGAEYKDLNAIDNMLQLAMLLRYGSDPTKAELMYHSMLEHIEPLNPDFELRIARVHSDLGSLYSHLQDRIKALEHLEHAFLIKKKHTSLDDIDLASTQRDYAYALARVQRYDDAISLQKEIYENELGKNPQKKPALADAENALGRIFYEQGSYVDSEKWFRLSKKNFEDLHGPLHYMVASINSELSRPLKEQGEFTEALQLIDKSIEIYGLNFNQESTLVLNVKVLKAEILLESGASAEAASMLEALLPALMKKYNQDNKRIMHPNFVLGHAYIDLSRYEEADSLMHLTYSFFSKSYGEQARFTRKSKEAMHKIHQLLSITDHDVE